MNYCRNICKCWFPLFAITVLCSGAAIDRESPTIRSKSDTNLNLQQNPAFITEEAGSGIIDAGNPTKKPYHKFYELPPNYSNIEFPLIRNGQGHKIVHASVGVLIHSLRSVDELNEDITLELDLKTRWIDEHIQQFDNRTQDDIIAEYSVPYIAIDSSYLKKLWWPSIIFNDVAAIIDSNLHKTNHPKPVQLRIFERGLVQMVTRLVVKIYCPMDFTYYPADTQTCKICLRSHVSSDKDILLHWHNVKRASDHKILPYDVYLADRTDGSFNKYLHSIDRTTFRHPLEQSYSPETYTVLEFSLSAKRKLSFHLLQTFTPSAFLILITWLSFFLPTSMLEVRIGIAMTTLLTLTAMFSSIKEYTPNVSYVKAIDIWMLVCITLVFITLFEFAALVWLRKTIEKNMKKQDEFSMLNSIIIRMRPKLRKTLNGRMHSSQSAEVNDVNDKQSERQKLLIYKKISKAADRFGFLFVAGTFVAFNIIFWSVLLVKSKHFHYDVNLENNAPFPV